MPSCQVKGVIATLNEVYAFWQIDEGNDGSTTNWKKKISEILAGADMYYYCTLAGNQVVEFNEEHWAEFVDINDIYTSFLFNLLEESLSIKAISEDLSEYEEAQNWVDFYSSFAKLVFYILDFESATAAANPQVEEVQFFSQPIKSTSHKKNRAYKKIKEIKPLKSRNDIVATLTKQLLSESKP
jgi:hypothetical protein